MPSADDLTCGIIEVAVMFLWSEEEQRSGVRSTSLLWWSSTHDAMRDCGPRIFGGALFKVQAWEELEKHLDHIALSTETETSWTPNHTNPNPTTRIYSHNVRRKASGVFVLWREHTNGQETEIRCRPQWRRIDKDQWRQQRTHTRGKQNTPSLSRGSRAKLAL